MRPVTILTIYRDDSIVYSVVDGHAIDDPETSKQVYYSSVDRAFPPELHAEEREFQRRVAERLVAARKEETPK